MMRRSTWLGFLAVATLLTLLAAGWTALLAQTPPPGSPPPGMPGPPPGQGQPGMPGSLGQPGMRPPGMMPMPPDSAVAERDSLANLVLKKIAGREEAPAESVFKDIQILKGMTASRVVRIMNMGFGRSLGVGCFHCHARDDWAKSDKKQKKAARDMWKMTHTINDELLAKIETIGEPGAEKPTVNCSTCHRGSTRVSPRRPPADTTRAAPERR